MDPFDRLALPLDPADRGPFAARVRAGTALAEPAEYGLAGAPVRVLLRHGRFSDVGVFHEVFHDELYVPPPPVAALLAALGRAPRIADAGGNVGLFGAWALARWPGAQITSYEPDPDNLAVLERCAARNAGRGRWDVVPAAVAPADGTAGFAGGMGAISRLCDDGPAQVATVDILDRLDGVDLLKLDTEGGEWAILADERLAAAGPPAVVLEHHPAGAPGGDEPRAAAHRLVAAAGYPHVHVVPDARTDGVGMLWAWRA
jgi:FkbM family methyltransferase